MKDSQYAATLCGMSATIHLILGSPGALRNDRLIAAYREAAVEFGAALFLTPSRRHANQIRDSLSTAIAPLIFDLQSFADELVRLHEPTIRPHSDGDRQLLLDSVLAELRDGSELPYFARVAETRGYAEAAGGYVAELKDAGVDLRQLLKASPNRDEGVSPNRHAQATRIFQRYQHKLAKLHRFDAPDRLGRAAELWTSGKQEPFDRVQSVFVSGFTAFAPFQRKLLDSLRETVEHLWLELPDGEKEAFDEPRALRKWIATASGKRSLFNIEPRVEIERVELDESKPPGLRWLVEKNALASQPPLANALTPPPPLPGGEGEQITAPAAPGRGGWEVRVDLGIKLIEAPGELGEARLVARQVRELLAGGTSPDRIRVVTRRLTRTVAELYREIFDEYSIPYDIEGAETLNRVPAVAFLLKSWRLQSEDWPFAPVAAMLRSSYFRPNWPEVESDPEVPAKAETLLRMLGETRGRTAYLAAVRTWEHTPPEALEDEQAEEPVRRRKQRLAARCRPFLERFFQAWDRLKPSGTVEAAVGRLKAFADDIGLSLTANSDPGAAAGLARFWHELDRWAAAESAGSTRKALRTERFARVLAAITSVPCRGRTPRGRGRVALLSASAAVGLDCDYLFLIELGEGSWPDLSPPTSLLDDPERDRLRRLGFALENPESRLKSEQLKFLNLSTAPRKGLFLSYAAVDERGQALLPSSFLRELKTCFPADSIPTIKQRMLLDGYFDQEPITPSELRVQVAHDWSNAGPKPPLAPDLFDNLQRAAAVHQARFGSHAFSPFDGELRLPAVAAELARRFAPEKILSPTALETYVACPFRFLLEHVMRLEPLEDPSEEVEKTRRGAAFHRALSRFHTRLNELVPIALNSAELPNEVTDELLTQVDTAIEEYAVRAPSRATAELWRLEGVRLKRAAKRYRDHWQEFRKPWREKNATPLPQRFEADFGVPGETVTEPLVISVGGIDVRIGGRIDRVDVTALEGTVGYWVIDYKTGRATNYQAAQVERFEKLQLPLYALAVERVLLKGRPARPLGLAYWLVTDSGHKPMLPTNRSIHAWLADPGKWERFRTQLEEWVSSLVKHIRAGDFPLSPRSDSCTDTCSFGPVCRIAQSRSTGKLFALELPVLAKEKEPTS